MENFKKVWNKIKIFKCGDIVEVKSNSIFPCDILLLYSQTADSICQVTTANLDGETNLKVRFIFPRC